MRWGLTIVLIILCGCTTTHDVRVVPIQGPLASSGVKTINATFTWNRTGHGTITIVMPNGETCTGEYSTEGRIGEAILIGNKGTTVQVKYFVKGWLFGTHGYGVANDNKGNTYKLTF